MSSYDPKLSYDAPRRPALHERRWWLVAALVAVLLLAVAFAQRGGWNDGVDNRVGALPVASVVREGRVWVPMGPAALWPDDQMVAIGRTKDGEKLYTRSATTVGGGGGGLDRAPHAFLRVAGGQYQPVALVGVVPQ